MLIETHLWLPSADELVEGARLADLSCTYSYRSMDDDAIIRDMAIRRLRAIVANDRQQLADMLHQSYFYVDINGRSYDKRMFLNAFFDQRYRSVATRDAKVVKLEIDGNVATLHCRIEGSFCINGRIIRGPLTTSHTLAKCDGKWLFLSGHFG